MLYANGKSLLTNSIYVAGSFDRVRAGDCIVCFGKNDIYHVSRQLERRGVDVAVIYGTLPPGEQPLVVHHFQFYSVVPDVAGFPFVMELFQLCGLRRNLSGLQLWVFYCKVQNLIKTMFYFIYVLSILLEI